jgi:hypothetical protein
MKLKHNKLRNPSILFELLVRQITTDTFHNRESKAVDILQKYYNNTQISKEFKLYKMLSESKNLTEAKANVLINVALEAHKKLNRSLLKKQKYDLVSAIKETYDIEEFCKTKVVEYKTLASIYMLFEMHSADVSDPQNETKYRFTIMESICQVPKKEEKDTLLEEYNSFDKGTKALVYKILIQKFNDKYSNLNDDQKLLLKEYISNVSTSNNLREYVNFEYTKIQNDLKKESKNLKDPVRKVKIDEVLKFIEEVPENKQVCEKDIHNLLCYYELLNGLKQLKSM